MITFGLIRVCCARFSLKWRFKGIRSHYNCVCSWPLKWLSDISWYSFAVAFDVLVSFCLVCLVGFYALTTNSNRYNRCPQRSVHALCIYKEKLIKRKIHSTMRSDSSSFYRLYRLIWVLIINNGEKKTSQLQLNFKLMSNYCDYTLGTQVVWMLEQLKS